LSSHGRSGLKRRLKTAIFQVFTFSSLHSVVAISVVVISVVAISVVAISAMAVTAIAGQRSSQLVWATCT
jgi:hypothetical protein